MEFKLSSPAFEDGGSMPALYTCQDREITPPLEWESPPDGTESFALVVEDPDTPFFLPTVTHWIVFNIPAATRELPEGVLPGKPLDDGSVQGRNLMRRSGYMGPCPPWGEHRYHFTLFALDTRLESDAGKNKRTLLKAMEGHVLGRTRLTGRYAKTRKRL
jgi:Raf kinase inhibitor-like YbhB/YbcL family protein